MCFLFFSDVYMSKITRQVKLVLTHKKYRTELLLFQSQQKLASLMSKRYRYNRTGRRDTTFVKPVDHGKA